MGYELEAAHDKVGELLRAQLYVSPDNLRSWEKAPASLRNGSKGWQVLQAEEARVKLRAEITKRFSTLNPEPIFECVLDAGLPVVFAAKEELARRPPEPSNIGAFVQVDAVLECALSVHSGFFFDWITSEIREVRVAGRGDFLVFGLLPRVKGRTINRISFVSHRKWFGKNTARS